MQEPLNPDSLLNVLGPSMFARNIIYFESIDSTNRVAKELGSDDAPEGTLVLAEHQNAGRGRLGRDWLSRPRLNLQFSILLRPPLPPPEIFVLNMVLALAAIRGMERTTGVGAGIKWPNDICIGPKKLAGILTEFSARGKVVDYAVLGIGINVNWHPAGPDLLYPVTSLRAESGMEVSRAVLLTRILAGFERYYAEILRGGIDPVYEEWNRKAVILGKEIDIIMDGRRQKGTALRIDRQGALVIKDSRGEERRILNGDVSLRS